jgi:hypothetical protein
MAYTSEDNDGEMWIYEIILESQIDEDEGDEISKELYLEFPEIDFTFEASLEV